MGKTYWIRCFLLLTYVAAGAEISSQEVQNSEFHKKLNGLLSFTVPVISVSEANERLDEFILLDTRELEEYSVSHLPGALHAGYEQFDIHRWAHIDQQQPILLYCSVGYRSERIGEKFIRAGYKNVFNLYGSIFEWVNSGLPVTDRKGNEANRVHTYNKRWSRWLDKKGVSEVW